MNATDYLEKHWEPRAVWTHLKWPKHQARLKKCAELVEGLSFCDVGCAFGHSTQIMAGFRPGDWAGLEFSKPAIIKAATLFPSMRWIYLNTAKELPNLAKQFDSVVCSEVLEHVDADAEFAKVVVEMARRKAVFTTPTIKVSDPGHLRVYDLGALEKLFKAWKHKIIREGPFFYIVVTHEL